MKLPTLPIINFYEKPSSCFNFIHVIQAPDSRNLIRFAEHRLARSHSDVYNLLRKELAQALKVDDDSLDRGLFYNNYRCVGGGYAEIRAEDRKHQYIGEMQTECIIRGSSSTYGAADLDLVKRILEDSRKFDIVKIGH